MRVDEAAEALAVTSQTIQRYVKKGFIRSVRLPTGHQRVYRADVIAILNANNDDKVH